MAEKVGIHAFGQGRDTHIPAAVIVFQIVSMPNRRQVGHEPINLARERSKGTPHLVCATLVLRIVMIGQSRIEIPQGIGDPNGMTQQTSSLCVGLSIAFHDFALLKV